MVVLVDIDGTLAIRTNRGPFDWKKLSEDRVNLPLAKVLDCLVESGHEIVFITGRDERIRVETEKWIFDHTGLSSRILMRGINDARPDVLVKEELVLKNFQDLSEILCVFDDRTSVVRMWRSTLGLTCFQVAEGDF